MSKSDANRYLDDEKKYLCTANNLLKFALQGFRDTNILEEQQGSPHLTMAGYTAARSQLTKALLFGKIEACAGLALFNQQGIGGPINLYNQKLFLTIGSKFEHPACKQTLAQLQNNNYNVEKEANIWVNHIQHKRDLDKEITTSELAINSNFLADDLKKSGVSLDAYNAHILIVKPKEEIAENYNYNYPQAASTTANSAEIDANEEEIKEEMKILGKFCCQII